MKKLVLMSLSAAVFVAMGVPSAWAQNNRIYRCGSVYTNNPLAGQKDCKPVSGGNVTVVQSPRSSSGDGARAASVSQAAAGLEGERMRQRNAEARQTLEAEILKAQAKQEDMLKQFNNGEPEKTGIEYRNYQRYLDRVADLKSDMDRNENQIEGMRRELDRLASESK
jgi:hypothetical protein